MNWKRMLATLSGSVASGAPPAHRVSGDGEPDSQEPENYVNHFHAERNHQGKGNLILFPAPEDRIGEISGDIQTRVRLGGLLKFYYREAA